MKKLLSLLLFLPACLIGGAVSPTDYIAVLGAPQVASAPAGFSPSNNYPAELVYWWDASLYNTNGGTVFFPDRYTNALHFTNTTASAFPTYNASGLNSLPTITFDGAGDIVRTRNAWSETQPSAIIVVMRYLGSGTAEQRFVYGSDASVIWRANATSNARHTYGQNYTTYWTNGYSSFHIWAVCHASSTGSFYSYTNGVYEFHVGSSAAPGSSIGLAIGGRFSDAGNGMNAEIAEVIQFKSVTQANLTQLTNVVLVNTVSNLSRKYNITTPWYP